LCGPENPQGCGLPPDRNNALGLSGTVDMP
jgi:hypothetical protein